MPLLLENHRCERMRGENYAYAGNYFAQDPTRTRHKVKSPRSSRLLVALALVGLLGLGTSGCSKDDPPAAVQPPPGVVQPSDLAGKPTPKVLGHDEGVTQYCGPVPEMQIQEDAASRYIVEYKLDDQ